MTYALPYTARMNLRGDIDPDEIQRLYTDEGWTMAEPAAHYGCGETTIRRRLEELGLPTRPRGPYVERHTPESIAYEWTSELAYAVGLITTDGNLSKDGRHISVVSKDVDLLETLRDCLSLENSITPHEGGWGQGAHRLQ